MKKTLVLIIALVILSSACLAVTLPDLSGYSFSELAALRDRCLSEMMNRDEWQEVTVPQGCWEVGVQIPAGTWLIRCADLDRDSLLMAECEIRWGKGRPDNSGYWDYKTEKGHVEIFNPNSKKYKEGQTTEFVITLEEGDFIYIHPQYNKAVFMPYVGSSSFGFK